MRTNSEEQENTVERRGNTEEGRHLQLLLSYFLWLYGLNAIVSPCILGIAGTLAEGLWGAGRSAAQGLNKPNSENKKQKIEKKGKKCLMEKRWVLMWAEVYSV